MRRPVAVVVSRFPLVTETFVLRELDELERQGRPVRLVPLLRESPPVVHPEARPWVARALYTPFLSPAIVAANLRALRRQPGRYLGTALRLVAGTAGSPAFLARSLALFPKAVYLAERLSGEGIAHLHAHFATHPATVGWIASRLAPLGYSFTVHAHDLFVDRTFLAPKLAAARFVRAISRFNRERLVDLCPEAASRIEVIHVGVPPVEPAAPDPARPGAPPLLLCVSALKPYKGIPVFLAACARLRERGVAFRAAVVGDGPLREALRAEIAERGLGDRVELLGARSQQEVARLIEEAAVVVMASVVAPDGQMEGIPVALMEAGAAGRAVAAPRLSGIPELVESGRSGELFPPGDDAALADILARLLADPDRRRRFGAALRARVDADFRLDRTTGELLARLDRVDPPIGDGLGELARGLCAAAGLPAPAGIRLLSPGPDACVAELLVAGSRAVLKQHLSRPGESAAPRERARREAAVLRRLASELPAPFGAPRVLAADDENASLLLGYVPGESLDDALRRLRRAPVHAGELAAAGARAGAWIRALQERIPPPHSGDPRPALLVRAAGAAETAVADGGLEPQDALAALRRLERLAERAEARAVARHGDLWPGNVRLAQDRVAVLDLEGFGPGLPAEDVAALLVHARLYFPPPLASRWAAFAEAVLAGYGSGLGEDPPGMALCRAEVALRALASGADRRGHPLLRPWRRRELRRELLGAAA